VGAVGEVAERVLVEVLTTPERYGIMYSGNSYTLAGVVSTSRSEINPAFWRGLDWVFIELVFRFCSLGKNGQPSQDLPKRGIFALWSGFNQKRNRLTVEMPGGF
jgi:hypothetical protein